MTADSRQFVDPLPTHYSIGVGELVSIVWRRKFCLVLCLGATLALGAVYFVKAERVYEVKCRLLVEKQELPLSEFSSAQRSSRDLEFLGTQAEILGSTTVLATVVDQLQWPVPTTPGVSPVAMLKDQVSVRPVMGTNVLSVTLQADDARRSVQAMNALVESYRAYMQRTEHDVHAEMLNTLTQSERDVRKDLMELEDHYRQLREKSPLIATFKNGADIQLAHIDELGRKLADVRGRRVELENQLRIASAGIGRPNGVVAARGDAEGAESFVNTSWVAPAGSENTPPIAAVYAAELPTLTPQMIVGANLPGARDIVEIQNQLVKAKVLERELYSRFGPKHPEVRAVAEQIASLMAEEQKAVQAGHELLRRELDTVAANEKQLAELCQSELNQTKSLDNYHLQEQQTVNQLTRLQAVHDSLLTQLRQWKLAGQIVSDGRAPIRISVLEQPLRPTRPVWPSRRVLAAICGAVGLVTGLSLIAFLEQRERTRARQDLSIPASPVPVV